MRYLYADGQPVFAEKIFQMLAASHVCIDGSTRILDLGCGSGILVYEFRDRGYDAFELDMYNHTNLRDQDDLKYFRFQHADRVSLRARSRSIWFFFDLGDGAREGSPCRRGRDRPCH
jgi:SAM-dependent methyltransferase